MKEITFHFTGFPSFPELPKIEPVPFVLAEFEQVAAPGVKGVLFEALIPIGPGFDFTKPFMVRFYDDSNVGKKLAFAYTDTLEQLIDQQVKKIKPKRRSSRGKS